MKSNIGTRHEERLCIMDEKLYDLCDWAGIEAIVYADHRKPNSILGPHITEEGILINVFRPNATKVILKLKNNKKYDMEMVDEEGFFAVIIPGKTIPKYTYIVNYEDGTEEEIFDMYSITDVVDEVEITKFNNGICYNVYDFMGAHPMNIDGVDGTLFVVWAPNALRVSVVGEFNDWKGELYMMSEREDTGVFELFVPGAKAGQLYKYEMKFKGDVIALKSDPYARESELMPGDASIICNNSDFKWSDSKWIDNRKSVDVNNSPMAIYEMHFGTWRVKEDGSRYTYRELAPILADYIKDMGYTHIELMPITEYREEESLGYKVTGYYAPTSRYGSPDDFKYFVDYLHQKNIGVIIDWVPAYFASDRNALDDFDGTNLYDHMDPLKGEHPLFKTRMFNYGRPEVSNFLIANAFFWIEEFHVDGLRINDVASMLNLDWGRGDGQWIPNMYGENQNLEAVEFFKHLNSIHTKRADGTVIIAEDASSWQKITEVVEESGLGFDFKWNSEWANDLMEYMKCDPLFRKGRHNQITLSMLYNYSEKFILELSHDLLDSVKGSIVNVLPGEYGQKLANLKAIIGYMMIHPGKKHIFMGQDFAQPDTWNINNPLDWKVLNYEANKGINDYVKALLILYRSQPALYAMDYENAGFEWINDMDSDRSILSFVRKTDKNDEMLLAICNFTPISYEGYSVGVPFKGRYKEIFNSDSTDFGGSGKTNPRLKNARPSEYDGRPFYINVTVPPMGISIYNFTPVVPSKEEASKTESNEETTTKQPSKSVAKKQTIKKTTTTKKASTNKNTSATKVAAATNKGTTAKKTASTEKKTATTSKPVKKSEDSTVKKSVAEVVVNKVKEVKDNTKK